VALLDEWVSLQARARPEHPAVVADGRVATYGELDRQAVVTARRLAAAGVGEGDRVATTMPPSIEFAVLLHALPRLGAALVPLNARLTAAGRRRQEEQASPKLVLDEPPSGEEADAPLRTTLDPEAVHTVLFTSGTSGAGKAVELSCGNHHASATASARNLGVEEDDRWLCPLPLFHVGGLAILLRSAIYGTTAIVHAEFDAGAVAAELTSGRATLASLVPTMLRRLREHGLERAPALRAVLLGGGPVPAELLRWATARGLPVRATYGMTETASQIATAAQGETAARPLPGVQVRISPEGEILVSGPMVAPAALAPDGWLHTGDEGQVDAEGRLRVRGRLKELIVTGGENVSPGEVEQALLAHPAVADAAVVGRPDPEWGEAVTAFVVLDGEASGQELEGWCRGRLAGYQVPKRIERVSELPRNAAGKLMRDELGSAR